MQIFKKHAGLTAILQVFGILILVAVLATTMLLQNAQVITIYLGQESYKVVDNEEDSVNSVYYKPDYDSLEELQADETVFAEQVQAEGSVLLQNKNLPLKDAKRVTLLGSASADGAFYISGGGSAAIDTTLKPPMQEVFEDAGFTVNPVMLDFYLEGAARALRARAATTSARHRSPRTPPPSTIRGKNITTPPSSSSAAWARKATTSGLPPSKTPIRPCWNSATTRWPSSARHWKTSIKSSSCSTP